MDTRLLKYYNRELQYLREMGGEFAAEFPKIAGRLGLDGFECADPYVERLLEGFSFLTARIQLKLDAEFPRFTQHLLEMVYPQCLSPTPSMAVAQFKPDVITDAVRIPRNSILHSVLGKGEQTPCEFRTAHEVTLWPVDIVSAEYVMNATAVMKLDVPDRARVKTALRLRLKTNGAIGFDKLAMDSLNLYLRGRDELPMRLYEQLFGNALAVVVRPAKPPHDWLHVIDKKNLHRVGFSDGEAMLPYSARSFSGYRLLHEYFAFHERFLFAEISGLNPGLRRCPDSEIEVIVLFDRVDLALDGAIDASHFALYCTPAVNLFPKHADRIHIDDKSHEHHVVPDRTRPMDFEVYEVTGVTGIGESSEREQDFLPFYATNDLSRHAEHKAYYALQRSPRVLSVKERNYGPRSGYIGSELYLSLVDANEAPYSASMRQIAVNTLCSNRDLPMQMTVGKGATDFTMESGAPVTSVRVLAGPTKPRPSAVHNDGETLWRLVSHLSLNYMSLMDSDERQGAAALRDLLQIYGDTGELPVMKQIEGVKSVVSRPVTRRMPVPGPISFGRGLEITVTFDENAFQGTGVFLLGAVLDEFFAKYVSINTFIETVVKTTDRGEIMRWPTRVGKQPIL